MTSRGLVAALALTTALGVMSCSDAEQPAGRQGTSTEPTASGSAATSGNPSTTGTTRTTAPPSSTPTSGATALVPPQRASTAGDLLRRLVAAEELARDGTAPERDRAQAAFDTQVLYRQLARRPAWHDAVLAGAGRHRATVRDHLEARAALRSVLTTLSTVLPAWRVAEPLPAPDLLRLYRKGQRRHGVPWEVLAAVNLVETLFGRIHGLSTAGARGPMQFIPSTWAAYGEGDIDDPHDSIMAAARYLAASGGDTAAGLDRALHAYNNHDGYVRGVRAYARILHRDPEALAALHRWQVLFLSARGDVWLPVGYLERRPLPLRTYLRRHPERLLGTDTG